MVDPILWGTQMEFAWDAWQKAFDAGILKPDRARFDTWWESVALHESWRELRELFQAAWIAAANDRNIQCTAGFDAWFANANTNVEGTWSAWCAAFDAGKLLPSRTSFDSWWDEIGRLVQWTDVRDKLNAAWGSGVQDRVAQCTAGFNAWWQEILDHQPVLSQTQTPIS